jgi:hypothetical protein
MTTAIIWNPFSDYMQTPTGRVEVEKRFPKFTLQFTQSLPKIWKTTSLAKSTLKQNTKKISKWSKKPTYYFMLDMPQVKFR